MGEYFNSQWRGEEIEQGLSVAIGMSQIPGIVKGTGRGGIEPCIPGEDYSYPVLKGSGAPDRETAASVGQFYIDQSATEPPYLYVNVGYNNDNGFLWESTMGLSALDPTAQGSFRLNPTFGETKGWFSTAMGINCEATADYSHAVGYGSRATAKQASAEGYYTNACGDSSHSQGVATVASGRASHTEGESTAAYGANAHAEGFGTIAGSDNQHVQGKYNVRDDDKKYAHIVGNGADISNLSNAHTLDWDGNAWFKGKVFVGGTSMDDATELGTGGGGGIDELLDDDGKIKPEFLPDSGGTTVILPETEAIYNAGIGAFVILSFIDASMFTDGESYTVNWNGTDYETIALPISYNGMNGIAFGDVGILQGAPTTGEPFMVAVLDAASKAATGAAALIVPIDGSTSVTVSISGNLAYDVTENATIFVDIYGTIAGTYHGASSTIPENIRKRSHTNTEILALVKWGKNVIIRNFYADLNDAIRYYHLEKVDYGYASFSNVSIDTTVLTCGVVTVRSSGEMTMYERAISSR